MASTTTTPARKSSTASKSSAKKASAPRKTFKRAEVEAMLRRLTRRGYPTDARAERAYTRKVFAEVLGTDS